jgi:hypothetical protein
MTDYARIQDGIVAELFSTPGTAPIYEYFSPEIAQMFVEVPAGLPVMPGWTYADFAFSPPNPWPPPSKPQRIPSTVFFNRFPPGALNALASSPQTLVLLITCAAAGEIDLTDPEVQAGIEGLVPSVLTEEQAAAIMDH